MSRLSIPLRLLALTVTFCFVRGRMDCTGGPVPIPDEDNFKLFALRLQQDEEANLPSISRAQALGNLGAGFLEQDTIAELADISDSFLQVPFSSLSPISGQICNIPLTESCGIQRCGCGVQRAGRKLLLCFGYRFFRFFGALFDCKISGAGRSGEKTNTGRRLASASDSNQLSSTAIGLCIRGTCTLFRVTTPESKELWNGISRTCPGVSHEPITSQQLISAALPTER